MIKPRIYFDVKFNDASNIADIYVYGVIGYGWYSEESREAFEFVQEFKQAEKNASRINIHINSPGGLVEEGLPIFNVINSSQVETHSYIDGIAYSMAAIVALAADHVHIASNGLFLLHNASGWSMGNAKDFRDVAQDLDKYDTALITSITTKTGLSEDQVRDKWFDYQDHLFTARQALDAKLVDSITDHKADIPEDISNWDLRKVHDYFSNDQDGSHSHAFFDQILTKVKTALKINSDKKNPIHMTDLQKIADAFNLQIENLSVDSLIKVIQDKHQSEIQTISSERDTAQSDLAKANQTLSDNTTQVDALGEEIAGAANFSDKVSAIKAKLNAKPGSAPTTVTSDDGKKNEDVDWDTINSLEHNKHADQL